MKHSRIDVLVVRGEIGCLPMGLSRGGGEIRLSRRRNWIS
jgi:hypothetical protein